MTERLTLRAVRRKLIIGARSASTYSEYPFVRYKRTSPDVRHTGPGIMLPSFTVSRQPGNRWTWQLLSAVLVVVPLLAPPALLAQDSTGEITAKEIAPTFKLQSERNLVIDR